jgi:hypothetical protein
MCRRCIRLIRVLSDLVLLIALAAEAWPGPAHSMSRFGSAASDVASGRYGLLRDFGEGGRAAFFSAVEDPYVIDGLVRSNLLAGIGGKRLSVWLDWSHLGHRLYREDHASALIAFELEGIPLRCIVNPEVERHLVTGFPAERSGALSCSVCWELGRAAWVSFESQLGGGCNAGRRTAVASFAVRSTSFGVRVDRLVSGATGGDTGVAVEARPRRACALLSAYRMNTNEVSGGLLIEAHSVLTRLMWSEHPALGSTLSMEVGRVWQW